MQYVIGAGLDILARMVLVVTIVPCISMAVRFCRSCSLNLKHALSNMETDLAPIEYSLIWLLSLQGALHSIFYIWALDKRFLCVMSMLIIGIVLALLLAYFLILGGLRIIGRVSQHNAWAEDAE